MNWFWLSLLALLCWSGSDLFSKIGCYETNDRTSHLKMVTAVGIVMGLHAAYMVFFQDVAVSWGVIWTYLPVSLLYIGSMTLGYLGLRYIELSVSSPICNSSGALVAVLCLCTGALTAMPAKDRALVLLAVGLVCAGVIGLGVVEAREDETLREKRQARANRRYAKSALALCLPLAYCLLDAGGTFADSLVLEHLNEDSANVAYELTFCAAGLVCLAVLLCRRVKFTVRREAPKYLGALCETAGQLCYIYALADEEHVMMAAPMISAYCVLSAVWGRIFLRERLSWKHYLMIALVVAGIVLLGIFDI